METDVIIRKAVTDDLDIIGRLWQELMDFHRGLDPYFTRASDGHELYKEFVSKQLASDNSCVLVAETEGAVVGYCLAALAKYPPLYEKGDYGAIFDLAISEKYRRMGIGEMIYRKAQSWFSRHGVNRIELRLAVTNEISAVFWRKMGFKPFMETAFKII